MTVSFPRHACPGKHKQVVLLQVVPLQVVLLLAVLLLLLLLLLLLPHPALLRRPAVGC